jgi:lipoprotein-anchoring transpeptidase ErfK/SrfK
VGASSSDANVRAGPSTESPIVGHLPGGQRVKVLVEGPGQNVQGSATWYRIDGGRWIVVDRSQHTLTLVDQGTAQFATYVALGVAGRETPNGTYSTWGKYRADDMTSASVADPGGYYDLPNVPDTQYYRDGGFAIHGTYWHDEFGTDQSHGCINVTWADGEYLFDQTLPYVRDGQITTPTGQPATEVLILP